MEPLIAAQCDWLFDCCSSGELTYFVGPFTLDAENCVDRMLTALETGSSSVPTNIQPLFRLLYVMYELDQDRVKIDMKSVRKCGDFLSDRTCNMPSEEQSPDRCVPGQVQTNECNLSEMIRGKQGVGQECDPASSFECKDGLRCIDHGYVGICAHASAEDEYCFSDSECQSDLFCDLTTGTCETGALAGEPCSYLDPSNPIPGTELVRCAAGLSCDPESNVCVDYCAPGALCSSDLECPEDYLCILDRCRLPGEEGDPCGRDEDCVSEACDGSTGLCRGLKPIGASCFAHDECTSRYCDPSTQLCHRGSAIGQPCPTGSSLECIGGWCDVSDPTAPICREFLGEGSPCSDPQACDADQELMCVDGVCRSLPLPNGVPCSQDAMCESRLCWQGVCQEGSPVGSSCDTYGGQKPCTAAAYCLLVTGSTGTCTPKLAAGAPCETSEQCWGQCIEAWGEERCDATPARDTAVCDGLE